MSAVLRFLAMLLVVGLPTGCAGAQEATVRATGAESGSARVDERDNGRRVELHVGDVLILTLRANYSTGYSWEVVSSGEPVLRQLGPPTFSEDSHLAGAGGTAAFRFRAEQAGSTSLELVYVRPWEKNAKPARTFSLTVVVTE